MGQGGDGTGLHNDEAAQEESGDGTGLQPKLGQHKLPIENDRGKGLLLNGPATIGPPPSFELQSITKSLGSVSARGTKSLTSETGEPQQGHKTASQGERHGGSDPQLDSASVGGAENTWEQTLMNLKSGGFVKANREVLKMSDSHDGVRGTWTSILKSPKGLSTVLTHGAGGSILSEEGGIDRENELSSIQIAAIGETVDSVGKIELDEGEKLISVPVVFMAGAGGNRGGGGLRGRRGGPLWKGTEGKRKRGGEIGERPLKRSLVDEPNIEQYDDMRCCWFVRLL
ncbi:hypothetical protein Salat_2621500 [Sesamum alatum]|uniref:Uncharacterized protein n=1 Tax=Sesamum alatum TaxID=300844 RepID=A0AAE2CAL5_9LAMI|nr:hypothetical protein Salat_2621500 [Sesamum alatum]